MGSVEPMNLIWIKSLHEFAPIIVHTCEVIIGANVIKLISNIRVNPVTARLYNHGK